MKDFLVQNQCYISTIPHGNSIIVLNGKTEDKRITFKWKDDCKNDRCFVSFVIANKVVIWPK
jgi:hypothetical protein